MGQGGKPVEVGDIGAPDERQHANYIRFLVNQHKLPVLIPGSPDVGEEYESHQPPLYYVISSVPAVITGQTDVETAGFGRTIRIFNCLIGATGIIGVFFAALWATKREDIALVATAFAALLPMNCALSGTVSNDPLLISMISWAFAFCAKALGSEDIKDCSKALIWAAVFSGLACLTKSTGLVSVAALAATVMFLRRQLPVQKLAGYFFISILIVSPIWIRNQILYGDPLAQKVFQLAFTGSPKKELILGIIESKGSPGSPEVQYWMNWVGYWSARSYIGAFGYLDIWLNSSGHASTSDKYPDPNLLYKGILAFIVLAKLAFVLHVRNRVREVQSAIWVGLVIAAFTILLFIGFNLTFFQAQGRYLLPCLAPTALILAIGWLNLFKSKLMPVLITVTILFGGTTIYALTQLEPEFSARISGTVSPR